MTETLLPRNASLVELALEGAIDLESRFGTEVDKITGWKLRRPLDAVLEPFLVAEYGLGDLSRFFDDVEDLIDEGIDWQRIRGTPAAVLQALGWLTYDGEVLDAAFYRRRWNRFEIHLDRVRDNELPDLRHIEFLSNLSVAVRSYLRRGYRGYNVPAFELSRHRLSYGYLSQDSGIALPGTAARWSFGRNRDHDVTLSQASLEALGVWLPPDSFPPTWADLAFEWSDADFLWTDDLIVYRSRAMAARLSRLPCWVQFRDADGLIGYRRARIVARVVLNGDGPLAVGSQRCSVGPGTAVYVEARTAFGDGEGRTATTARMYFGAVPSDNSQSGLLWAGETLQLNFDKPAVAVRDVTIPFGLTVRERVRTLLRMP